MTSTADALAIGGQTAPNRVLLAPMSGVSDLPFRRIAHRFGAGLVVSEMVASEELVRQRADVVRRAQGRELSPFVIQLVGREAHWMAEGARIAEGLGADIIDINMGCPAREVTGKLSGSALMRDLDHALSLIEAVVRAVSVPVTLKMRLGWDDKSRNAAELAHARRGGRRQDDHRAWAHALPVLQGRADWSAVRDVTARRLHSRHRQRRHRLGRGRRRGAGCLGRRRRHDRPRRLRRAVAAGPHRRVPGDRKALPAAPSLAEQARIAREHVEAMLTHYGARSRPAQRAQAHRLVPREERPRRRHREGVAPPALHRRTIPRACSRPRPPSTPKRCEAAA